jgi:uncharacterized protein (TIGR03000 family)
MAAAAALAGLAATAGFGLAGPFSGGIGSAMIYGPYTGGPGYSYATAYHYSLPFTNNGFSSPWVYPYDWTSIPWNGYSYPGRPLFKSSTCFAAPAPVELVPVPAGAVATSSAPAVVAVHVPADAELWFDGSRTDQTGSDRSFESPPLPPGKVFHYTVRARWMDGGKRMEQFQLIQVRAGQQARATFPQP